MKQLKSFLLNLRGDIFKLLPMKEEENSGVVNHTSEYVETIIINMTGAMKTFPVLTSHKLYLYVLNNLQYLYDYSVSFQQWKKIVLRSVRNICDLYVQYGG